MHAVIICEVYSAIAERKREGGMELALRSRFPSRTEYKQIFARLYRHIRECPFIRLRLIIGEIIPEKGNRAVRTIVDFDPVAPLAVAVGNAVFIA